MENCDNTKLKGVQLRNEGAPFTIQGLYHEGVELVSNLRTTPKAVLL
jgi:hypothetical protein